MSDYNFLKPTDLEETLARLLNIQSQPGSDQEGNLLLLSLVNLLGIVSVMQKQLAGQESNLPVQDKINNISKDVAVNYDNGISGIKPLRKKTKELKAVENNPRKEAWEKNKVNNKIVNKMNKKTDETNSKIIKWDSRLKKKIKEPLYI